MRRRTFARQIRHLLKATSKQSPELSNEQLLAQKLIDMALEDATPPGIRLKCMELIFGRQTFDEKLETPKPTKPPPIPQAFLDKFHPPDEEPGEPTSS